MNIQPIPLAKLRPSKNNVRKTGGQSVSDLAASIHSIGLLQNLTVQPDGKYFEVICGSRRLAALKQLLKDGKLPTDYTAACNVVDDTTNITEASLAENTIREAMHPADQFEAFRTMAIGAASPAEIGARFGVSELVVKQRLQLANVSPKLLLEYRGGNATLDQMQALAITDDHAAQEAAWDVGNDSWMRNPSNLRRRVVNEEIPSDDVRVEFVGLDAYEAAGGSVRHDLFGEEAYIADSTLLDKLVSAKLNSIAAGLRAEGWAWVEVLVLPDSNTVWAYPEAGKPKKRPFTAEEQSRIDELELKNVALCSQIEAIDEDADDSQDEFHRLDCLRDELLEQIDEIKNGAVEYSANQKKKSGALVYLHRHRGLQIERGKLKPNQKPQADDDGDGGTPPPTEKAKGGLSQAAVDYLCGVRTGILRSQIRQNERHALAALVAAITLGNNFGSAPGAVKIRPQHSFTSPALREGLGEYIDIGQHLQDVGFEKLLELSPSHLIAILVDLVANYLTVGHEGGELAQLLGVKMSDHWTVTEEWLARQPKAYILGALHEADSEIEGAAKLKAADLAKQAAPLLAAAGWLPEPFREDGE